MRIAKTLLLLLLPLLLSGSQAAGQQIPGTQPHNRLRGHQPEMDVRTRPGANRNGPNQAQSFQHGSLESGYSYNQPYEPAAEDSPNIIGREPVSSRKAPQRGQQVTTIKIGEPTNHTPVRLYVPPAALESQVANRPAHQSEGDSPDIDIATLLNPSEQILAAEPPETNPIDSVPVASPRIASRSSVVPNYPAMIPAGEDWSVAPVARNRTIAYQENVQAGVAVQAPPTVRAQRITNPNEFIQQQNRQPVASPRIASRYSPQSDLRGDLPQPNLRLPEPQLPDLSMPEPRVTQPRLTQPRFNAPQFAEPQFAEPQFVQPQPTQPRLRPTAPEVYTPQAPGPATFAPQNQQFVQEPNNLPPPENYQPEFRIAPGQPQDDQAIRQPVPGQQPGPVFREPFEDMPQERQELQSPPAQQASAPRVPRGSNEIYRSQFVDPATTDQALQDRYRAETGFQPYSGGYLQDRFLEQDYLSSFDEGNPVDARPPLAANRFGARYFVNNDRFEGGQRQHLGYDYFQPCCDKWKGFCKPYTLDYECNCDRNFSVFKCECRDRCAGPNLTPAEYANRNCNDNERYRGGGCQSECDCCNSNRPGVRDRIQTRRPRRCGCGDPNCAGDPIRNGRFRSARQSDCGGNGCSCGCSG